MSLQGFCYRQVEDQNLLDDFGEVSFSAVFYRYKDSFSELLDTQSDFPCERYFLVPGYQTGIKKGVKIDQFQ